MKDVFMRCNLSISNILDKHMMVVVACWDYYNEEELNNLEILTHVYNFCTKQNIVLEK